MNLRTSYYLLIALFFGAGCANIVAPTGGEKDMIPPKLVSVVPADSQLNVRTAKIRLNFDEYVTVADASNQVIISPLLPIQPTVISLSKHVTISFPDSLLLTNTTYHITFGTAIRDLHEGNIYKSNGYLFSTGSYFDSLSLSGKVLDATNGQPDTAVTIVLYALTDDDSAFLRKKPMYAAHVNSSGEFSLQGLPQKEFHIYALRDKNNNLMFDDRSEWIGFIDKNVVPGVDSPGSILLRTFPVAVSDTQAVKTAISGSTRSKFGEVAAYSVLADTTDTKRRTHDITKPLGILFGKMPGAIDKDKIFLTYDSSDVTVEVPLAISFDSSKNVLQLAAKWAENGLYLLRLQKGFAKDSAGNDFLPGRYSFRTKQDEDYAKLTVNIPSKYYGAGFLFQVINDVDTIHQKPVLDSTVTLLHVSPGNYKLRLIVDENKNGKWDTGDLFGKKQPELVIPYLLPIMLKPGWENQVDFERAPDPVKKSPEKSPGRITE
jgi:hypothetical protein